MQLAFSDPKLPGLQQDVVLFIRVILKIRFTNVTYGTWGPAKYCWLIVAGEIKQIGNGLKASASGVDVPGTTFLLNQAIEEEGVLFAFAAFFRSYTPVRFQIWKPVNDTATDTDFTLKAELRTIPSVVRQVEVVSWL